MSSTEEDGVLLRQSQEVALKESEAEVESVVESVVQGEGRIVDAVEDESVEVVPVVTAGTGKRGFGEEDGSYEDPEVEDGSCAETAFFHSDTSDDRHNIDYLASKKCKLSLEIDWVVGPFKLCVNAFFLRLLSKLLMTILMRITVRLPGQGRRRRNRGRVKSCRPVESGHPNESGCLVFCRGLCLSLVHRWTVLARKLILQQFLPPRPLKVGILASFLLLLMYLVESSLGLISVLFLMYVYIVFYSHWTGFCGLEWSLLVAATFLYVRLLEIRLPKRVMSFQHGLQSHLVILELSTDGLPLG